MITRSTGLSALVGVVLLAFSGSVLGARDRRWAGHSSQGRPVTVVVRPDHTVYVAMTLAFMCSGPDPLPPPPPRTGVTVPPELVVGRQRHLFAFSANVGGRGSYSFALHSADQRAQVHGHVGERVALGTAKVWLFEPRAFTCFANVRFRAASANQRRNRPRSSSR